MIIIHPSKGEQKSKSATEILSGSVIYTGYGRERKKQVNLFGTETLILAHFQWVAFYQVRRQ